MAAIAASTAVVSAMRRRNEPPSRPSSSCTASRSLSVSTSGVSGISPHPLLDKLHDLPDRLVHERNAPQHNLDGLFREAGLERERVRGEHIGRVVHAPMKEVVSREMQELEREAVRIADLID